MPNLAVRSWPKFQRQKLLRPCPHSLANIIARDDQVLADAGPAPDDDMDVGMLGVPMIDGDPFEARAEIAFGIGHEVACGGFDIGEFSRIRRDNEPEMVAILRAPLRKDFLIDIVTLGTEHPGRIAVLRDAVTAEIGKMRGKWCALHAVTNDPGFDHRDTRPVVHSARRREAGGSASTECARPAR
jgi:hypothetical protein